MKNILDFGAVGDGVTVNTRAIQAAINSGGTVYIPKGVFVTGTLHLKSGGGLYLAHGAVLKASHNRADYNASDYCPQNRVFADENMAGTHLISAVEQTDISISGFGRIDGDSHHWVNEAHRSPQTGFYEHPPVEDNRPGQMIFFAECKNVKVQDVQLSCSPFWHLFFHGCEDVQVRGLLIKGEKQQWVNDGIDIDCCKRVTVSDCVINTGDDAITLRAYGEPLLHSDGICEDIVISNCVLGSHLGYGIRIGVGDGLVRNCVLSNLVIRDSLLGIGIVNRFSERSAGVSIENLRFHNLSVSAHRAFDIRMCNLDFFRPQEKVSYTRDIFFDGVSAYCDRRNLLVGHTNTALSDIYFRNVDVHYRKEDPKNSRAACEWADVGEEGMAFYIRQADNVTFENARFLFDTKDDYPQGLVCDDKKCLTLINTNF